MWNSCSRLTRAAPVELNGQRKGQSMSGFPEAVAIVYGGRRETALYSVGHGHLVE